MSTAAATKAPKSTCPVCGKKFSTTKAGYLREHGPKGQWDARGLRILCAGSNSFPEAAV